MVQASHPRIPLDVFQAELARKLAESTQRPLAAGWLGISWHGVRALVPLNQAAEIFNPLALQRLPHTQPWVQGVASLRGQLALVVDWVRLLGLHAPVATRTADDTVYWLQLNPALGLHAALCVDQLLGLRHAADVLPEPDARPSLGVLQTRLDRSGLRWVELDLLGLCQSPVFLDPRLPAFGAPPVRPPL